MQHTQQGSPAAATPLPTRRAMRKGTHSCTECRRRKIKCDLAYEDSVCSNCRSRRTTCVSQRGDGARRQTRRCSRPGSSTTRIEKAPTVARKQNSLLRAPDALENSAQDRRAPFIDALGSSDQSTAVTYENGVTDHESYAASPFADRRDRPHGAVAKGIELYLHDHSKSICEVLRQEMPPYDTIMKVARERVGWWVRIHKAVRCMSDDPVEPFPDFVKDYYTSDRPSQLGKIAIAYAFTCKEDASHLYALVNRLVVSDMSHMSTTEGLECLILLGTLYSDEGQPRRAWMIFRRGVVAAQLTDLAQASLYSIVKKRLWMSIYRADRMMSLFLGLPYGFNDIHYQQLLESKPDDDYWDSPLTIGVAKLSGKTIDRNLLSSKHCFSRTLQIDEEMDELAATYPDSWWRLPTQLPSGGRYSDEIWTRLHLQMFFFHLRLYIYLPFLSTARIPAHSSTARLAAGDAARELLKRYLTLHSREGGGSLSECKLVDFMAFTAAVVLLLGYSREAGSGPSNADADTEMITSLIRLLWAQEENEKCQIAAQCRKTLVALLSRPGDGEEEVHIPFFGTISRKRIMNREPTADSDPNTQPQQADTENDPVASVSPRVVDNGAGYITPHSSVQSGSVNMDLPSDAYWQSPSQVEEFSNMPELDFLYQPENMTGFDAGWDFIMDVDSF